MFYLIYISSASKPMTDEELMFLLEQSRNRNLELDITGMLLYKNGAFMQMLEGDERVVRELYDVIRDDPRHTGVITILTGQIETRNFKNWTMGFCNMDQASDLPPFDEYIEGQLRFDAFHQDSENAYWFMLKFNELNP